MLVVLNLMGSAAQRFAPVCIDPTNRSMRDISYGFSASWVHVRMIIFTHFRLLQTYTFFNVVSSGNERRT